ncbi:MAG: barstar family protein [Bacteroidota bacterium]
MASRNSSYDESESLDWQILRDGPIKKYFSQDILSEDIDGLYNLRYQVVDMNMFNWTSKTAHKHIHESFDFPEYYGENLHAFRDCLSDMFDRRYRGLAIVFRRFDVFYSDNKNLSEGILDMISAESWEWLLVGQRLICMLQSNDPDLEISKIGGEHPHWNRNEWANASRVIKH